MPNLQNGQTHSNNSSANYRVKPFMPGGNKKATRT